MKKNDTKEKVREIELEMSEAIDFWRGVMTEASIKGWGAMLNFTNIDALNAIYIMNSVLSTIAIKSGFIKSVDDAAKIGKELRAKILEMYGIDTRELI